MTTTVSGALREALKLAMKQDSSVFVMGEDVGAYGGIYNVTRGLMKEFGELRVLDTPMAEITIVGAGVGSAVAGMRPVVELMYADFIPITMDQIINNAAKYYYLSGCKTPVPLVIRANFGTGKAEGAHQSQTAEGWFMNIPGLKVVMPSNPQDAFGLLLGSIRDNNPVLFLEHKLLYGEKGELDPDAQPINLSEAKICKVGSDLTVVSCGLMLRRALQAAEEMEQEAISVEVIDLRTIKPFDAETVCESLGKTGLLMTVEENPYEGGWGALVVDTVVSQMFYDLKAPPLRIASTDTPLPAAPSLEGAMVPSVADIKSAIRRSDNGSSGSPGGVSGSRKTSTIRK